MFTAQYKAPRLAGLLFASICLIGSTNTAANNGLNLIGFGAQSVGMGGADIAVVSGPSSLNINPAALPADGQTFDLTSAAAFALDSRHTDAAGNMADNKQRIALIGAEGYAYAFSKFTVGIGFFVQGGTGASFDDIVTPAGNRDDLSSTIAVVRLTPGIAWHATPALSVGFSVPLNIAAAKQDIFPGTSTASFTGYKIRGAYAFAPSIKLGALYQVDDAITVGATYSSKVKLKFEDAELRANFAAQGLGKVTYDDTTLEGISLPQQLGVGFAWRASPRLLLAADIDWLDWSSAVHRSKLTAKSPNSAAAPQVIATSATLNWQDQIVFAIGAAYQFNDRFTIRGGYNYGKSAQPSRYLSPLFVGNGEHTVTGGFGYRIDPMWRLDGALEWSVGRSITYSNPESLLGSSSKLETGYLAGHITLTRSW